MVWLQEDYNTKRTNVLPNLFCILNLDKQSGNGFMSCILCQQTLRRELGSQEERGKTLPSRVGKELEQE